MNNTGYDQDVSKESSQMKSKKAYRKLSKYHPDGEEPGAEEKYKTEAYETLVTEAKTGCLQ